MDYAEAGFISAYRKDRQDGTYDIRMDYVTCPTLENKIVIFTDPMLATGASLDASMRMIKDYGTPKEVHLVTIIASEYALSK
jgi:uracil phosphoribosyltransferase